MQKWYPKSDENGLQKGSQKWAKIIKMGSKNHPKMGFQKNIEKIMIFSTPTPLWIELWLQRELDFHFLIRCVFGTLLGPFLEVFWEAKWRPRASKRGSQKSLKIMMKIWSIVDRFWGPFGVQNGAQNRSKIDHFWSRGSRGSQGSILEGFWTNFGAILGWFLEGVWTYTNALTHCV